MAIALIDGDVLLHSALWKTSNFEEARDKADETYENWMSEAFLNEAVIALGVASRNYRVDIYSEYKHSVSRDKAREQQVEHKKELWKYISTWENTAVCAGFEADDQIGIWKTELGEEAVICSVDKDLKQLGGTFFYTKEKQFRYFEVSQEEADRFFLKQMLMGDSMDNIPGLPGVGPVKAEKICESEPTVGRLAERVLAEYKKSFGKDNWLSYFLSNGKMLFIQRTNNDWFSTNRYCQLFLQESNYGKIEGSEDGPLGTL